MSAVSLTAANIRALTENGAVIRRHIAGGTITIGQLVALSSDGFVDPANATDSQALSMAIGIAVQSYDGETRLAITDPVSVCVYGPVSGFSGMTPGANHYVSDTAGALDDAAVDRVLTLVAPLVEQGGIVVVHRRAGGREPGSDNLRLTDRRRYGDTELWLYAKEGA